MPYWRLSSAYFFYFAILGVLIPYWGLYLTSLGFSPFQIGQQAALLLVTKVVAPNLWAWIADHTGKAIGIVRLAALLALIFFLGAFFTTEYWWLTLVLVGFGFFWNALLPQLEAITLNHLGDKRHSYGRIRLWGSIGFIASVMLLGPVVDAKGPAVVVPMLTVALVGLLVMTFSVPEQGSQHHDDHQEPLLRLFRRREIVTLLLVCFLMQMSHAPLYTFFSIYLTDYGYTKTVIGMLWAFGVVCEIGIFLVTHRLFDHLGLKAMMLTAFVATVLRWLLVAQYPEHLWVLLFTQAMHALTFGVYHAAAIQYIHRLFKGRTQHRGQALYSSVSFGLGGGIGSFASGLLWTQAGPHVTFIVAAFVAGLACLVVVYGLRPNGAQARS